MTKLDKVIEEIQRISVEEEREVGFSEALKGVQETLPEVEKEKPIDNKIWRENR
jgi:hypothetical protein